MPRLPLKCLAALLFALPAFCYGNAALAQEPQVQLSVAADTTAIQPGKPVHLAITVTPQPGWHIYWQNPGDSGLPTKILWDLPPGFSAGQLQFPIPRQFTLPGNIVAYGYEGPTTFVATINPPNDLDPADSLPIEGTVSWLCCKEECIPGRKTFTLHLPVAQQAIHLHDALFKQAQSHMPGDTPWAAQQAADKPEITKTPDGQIITLRLGLPALPCQMFPTLTPDLTLSDITTTPTPAGNDIQFKIHRLAGTLVGQGPTQHLPVLIVYPISTADRPSKTITANDGRTAFYLNVNLAGIAPAGHP